MISSKLRSFGKQKQDWQGKTAWHHIMGIWMCRQKLSRCLHKCSRIWILDYEDYIRFIKVKINQQFSIIDETQKFSTIFYHDSGFKNKKSE